MRKIFIFKVSSSNKIGSGHIYRSIKIAKKLSTKKSLFITNNFKGNFNSLLKRYKVKILKNSEKKFNIKKDLNETIQEVKKYHIKKILIIDNYLNNLNWQKSISKYVDKIVIINDYLSKNFCDLYINENFFLNKKINNIFFKKKCKKLIGLKYCLISNRKLKKIKPIKPNIFLFFGGSDEKNLTIKILKKLRYNKNCYFHIVVNNIVLINKIKKLNLINIKIYPQKNNFYTILRKCNYALISGGSTIWDIIYNQIPLIAIPTAKNQIRNLNNLKKKKIIFLYKKKIDKNFVKYFNIFVSDSIRPSNLIDGLGLKRVVKEINKI